jgi:hypothetical protein
MPLWPAVQNSKKNWYFDDNFHQPEAWYRSFFPTTARVGRLGDELGYQPVVGEAAPYYLYHPLVPSRVASRAPGVRIVILLRDPVTRAHSHWNERTNAGVESLPFPDAIAAEPERLRGLAEKLRTGELARSDAHDFYSYLDRGDYLPQIERWQSHFDARQILTLKSEDLYGSSDHTLQQVHDFLGLPRVAPPAALHYNRLGRDGLEGTLREQLWTHFEPRVRALEAMLGRRFEWDSSSVT